MREIPLTQGKVAQVDDEDYEELRRFKWCAQKNWNTYYAMRRPAAINGKREAIFMHQSIMGRLNGFEIDHRDGDGLNNQKSNLRHVTHRQNCQNRKNTSETSKYPGISWDNKRNKWYARLRIGSTRRYLGSFTSEMEAFEAYREAVNDIGEKVVSL